MTGGWPPLIELSGQRSQPLAQVVDEEPIGRPFSVMPYRPNGRLLSDQLQYTQIKCRPISIEPDNAVHFGGKPTGISQLGFLFFSIPMKIEQEKKKEE